MLDSDQCVVSGQHRVTLKKWSGYSTLASPKPTPTRAPQQIIAPTLNEPRKRSPTPPKKKRGKRRTRFDEEFKGNPNELLAILGGPIPIEEWDPKKGGRPPFVSLENRKNRPPPKKTAPHISFPLLEGLKWW